MPKDNSQLGGEDEERNILFSWTENLQTDHQWLFSDLRSWTLFKQHDFCQFHLFTTFDNFNTFPHKFGMTYLCGVRYVLLFHYYFILMTGRDVTIPFALSTDLIPVHFKNNNLYNVF